MFLLQDLPAQPPSPWTLTESPGDSQLKLTRDYNGETIEVVVMADEVSFLKGVLWMQHGNLRQLTLTQGCNLETLASVSW